MIMHEQTGIFVPQGNSGALSDASVELLSDMPRAADMGRIGQMRVRGRFLFAAFNLLLSGRTGPLSRDGTEGT